jgi:hypothetical protein
MQAAEILPAPPLHRPATTASRPSPLGRGGKPDGKLCRAADPTPGFRGRGEVDRIASGVMQKMTITTFLYKNSSEIGLIFRLSSILRRILHPDISFLIHIGLTISPKSDIISSK